MFNMSGLTITVSLIWCVSYGTFALSREGPLIDSKVGPIQGLLATDGNYSMFLGIPYATVDPANPFGPSTPNAGFENTFNAFEESDICPQVEEYTNALAGSLDCLHLNIYVPNNASIDNPLAVMVWIHGGGFVMGSGGIYMYGPQFLVRHDIILVTLNYRLGPYGFLCLDVPEVPGNQGLKDQLLAIRWVKNNIEAFGGDVNKINVFGESAGGTSVDYHYIYAEEGLFHNVIIQSGTALAPMAVTKSDSDVPLKLAEHLGFTTNDLYDALDFLNSMDTNLVIAATSELNLNFMPCVEKEFDNVERYVTDLPVKMNVTKAPTVPVLVGFTSNEHGAFYGSLEPEAIEALNLFSGIAEYFNFDNEYLYEMEETVRRFYIGEEDINEDFKQDVIDFASDFYFGYGTRRSIDQYIQSGADRVYHYIFSYDGDRNLSKRQNNITVAGAVHADELSYLFDVGMFTETPTPEDQLAIERITTLWTNFAKFGNPTPEANELLPVEWLTVTKDVLYYLDIDSVIIVEKRPNHDRMAFWDLFYALNGEFQKILQNNSLILS